MDRTPLPNSLGRDLEQILQYIFDEALGSPIVLDAAPTTAGGELETNQIGYYSNNLYINIQGTLYRIALTAV